MRPPRIAELAEYQPGVTASTPVTAGPVRVAAASPDTPAPPPTSGVNAGNLFGNLFTSNSKPAAETKTAKKDESAIDRVARFMGLRGSDPAPAAEPAPTPKPRPAARPVQTAAPGAIRPAPVAAAAAAHAPAPAPAPVRTAETKPAAAPTPNSTISGAFEPLSAGSFDSRWSAFR